MRYRLQLVVTVAVVSVAAAGVVVGVTLATRDDPPPLHPQPGKPPVPKSVPGPAGPAVRAAFADWPKGSLLTLQRLGLEYPKSAPVQLYRGVGLLWAGYADEAQTALEQAKKLGRDTPWELVAGNLLHPQYFQGVPIFAPTVPNALLRRGSRLQQQGHQESAERLYARAARAAPDDPEAQTAKAVGLFDKDDLTPAFAALGPLTGTFPKSQIVRFYLGLLLAWTGQREKSCTQFRQAVALGPSSGLGRNAGSFVDKACRAGTGATAK